MGFNSGFKGLNMRYLRGWTEESHENHVVQLARDVLPLEPEFQA